MSIVPNQLLNGNHAAPQTTIAAPESALVVSVGSQQVLAVQLAQLSLADAIALVATKCASLSGTIHITVNSILDWPDRARYELLAWVREMGANCVLQFDQRPIKPDPFEAVLDVMVGSDDIRRCEAGRRLALEAAAFFHRDAIQAATSRVGKQLKQLGVRGVLPQTLLKEARTLLGAMSDQRAQGPTALAEAFLAQLGDLPGSVLAYPLLYLLGSFFEFAGAQWRRLKPEEIERKIIQFLQCTDVSVTGRMVKDIELNVRGLIGLDVGEEALPFYLLGIGSPAQTQRRNLLSLSNGLLDVDRYIFDGSSELLPHDPAWISTASLPFSCDPAATCPLWLETLNHVLPVREPSDHRQQVLQEFVGLTLLPGVTQLDKFLVLVGRGRNGKSTILTIVQELLGKQNVSHVALANLAKEFHLFDMLGKLANISGDMGHVGAFPEGILKQIVSGEPLQLNRKQHDLVSGTITARMIFGTNTLPAIADRTDGVWRRMIVLPFLDQVPPDQVDINRAPRLRNELPGILNWSLEGARRLMANGRFTHCDVCARWLAEHRRDCDPFNAFIDDMTYRDPNAQIPKPLLYIAYSEHCRGNGRKPRANTEFGRQILALPGVTDGRDSSGNRARYYQGIGLIGGRGTYRCPPASVQGRP